MKEYHLKTRVSNEEQIFIIEASDPHDALRQGIEWAEQDYESIEVYTDHPTLGNLELMSTDSAPFKAAPKKIELKIAPRSERHAPSPASSGPPPASSGSPTFRLRPHHFQPSWWVYGYFITGWLQVLAGLALFVWGLAAVIEEKDGVSLWTGFAITSSGGALLLFSHILELLEMGVYHLKNIDTKT